MKQYNLYLIITAVILLAGCVNESDQGGAENNSDGEKIELRLGHIGTSEADYTWEKFAVEFTEKIHEETNGNINIDTYPASQLGADRVMTESIQQGTLEMGLISTIAMGNFVPELQLWDLPYIFPLDNQVVDEILEGPIGETLAEKASEKGLVIIGYWENDWRSMTNSIKPIRNVEDLEGAKIRVVENQASLER